MFVCGYVCESYGFVNMFMFVTSCVRLSAFECI